MNLGTTFTNVPHNLTMFMHWENRASGLLFLQSGRQDSVFPFQHQVTSASSSSQHGLVGWNTQLTEVSSNSLSLAGEWTQGKYLASGEINKRGRQLMSYGRPL